MNEEANVKELEEFLDECAERAEELGVTIDYYLEEFV